MMAAMVIDVAADSNAREPKYYRLKQALLSELLATTPAGGAIPPERRLAERFGTSRTTVRQALQELVVEGRLERFQGRGTFVSTRKVAQPLQLTSYTEDMKAQGLHPTSKLLDVSVISADQELAQLLGIRRSMRVTRIERLRMASGDPMAIEATHLVTSRFPGLDQQIGDGVSLYQVLASEYGIELSEAEETIESALASPREARLLGTEPGMPLLLLSRHSFDPTGAPIEWVRSVYRGDRYKFIARLKRPSS